jgi:hypothetical protein
MSWIEFFGIICIISFLFPVTVIVMNRFYTNRSLAAMLIYFSMNAVYYVVSEGYVHASHAFEETFTIINNYLDVPLMLMSLLFFCPNKQKQRTVNIFFGSFLLYEIIISCIFGFKTISTIYILGPGFVLVLVHSFFLFVRQIRFSIIHRKKQGRTIMLASILFGYACYSLIYYFYFIQETPFKTDVLLLYFISSSLTSIFMAIGIHLMRKRMKELQALRVTRKELAMFFGH